MIRKEPRNEREANLALQSRELSVMTFHPNFLKPTPKREKKRGGIVQTFAKLLGR